VDGSEVPVDVDARPMRFGGRNMQLVVLVDIAERRRREREAAEQREELAHLSRVAMLGELSGAVAHEINQPLSAILTNAQAAQRMLRGSSPDLAEIDAILADIVADDRRAGEVILRLRKWLRKEHVEHESVSLNGVVLDTLHLVRADLLHRGVDVHLELAGELPRITGDRVQLQQVLLNLVMNGCDAMDGIPLRVLRLRTCRTRDCVRVEVIDRGHGISPAIARTMFEPFQTTKASGMGMGLAVCRSIIEAHGGCIVADDLPEGGARVAFELPAVRA
jgi:two-component system sensor kinase FixL